MPDQPSLIITVVGRRPATFIDDLVTNDRRTLAPGSSESLRTVAVRSTSEENEVWGPEPLEKMAPSQVKLVRLDYDSTEALEALRSGATVKLQHRGGTPLHLSRIASLADTARTSSGQLVIELDAQ